MSLKDATARRAYMQGYYQRNRDTIEARESAYREENKDSIARRLRERRLLRVYGLTSEAFDALLARQQGRCAICKSTESKAKGFPTLVVDHCHTTGKIRGLLCNKCNTGLGSFEESFDALLGAAKYIQEASGIV